MATFRRQRRLWSILAVTMASLGVASTLPAYAASLTQHRLVMPGNLPAGYGGEALSCFAPGNCVTVGRFPIGRTEGLFAAQEINGVWRPAVRLILNANVAPDPQFSIGSLQCLNVNYCLLTVTFSPFNFASYAAIFEMKSSAWGQGQRVALTGDDFTDYMRLSGTPIMGPLQGGCWSPKNCAVAGYYRTLGDSWQSYTVTETNGVWATAKRVLSPNPTSDETLVGATSCVVSSGCVLTARYYDENGTLRLFGETTTNGTWSSPETIAIPAGSNSTISISSLSCSSITTCGGTGLYSTDASNTLQFVVSRTNGTWGGASQVKMPSGWLQKSDPDSYTPPVIRCASDGSCIATSWGYLNSSLQFQRPMVVSATNGTWGTAVPVALPLGGQFSATDPPTINAVSCTTATRCLAGGSYLDGAKNRRTYIVRKSATGWQRAMMVPLMTDSAKAYPNASILNINCFANASCTASGNYTNTASRMQSLVLENVLI